MRFYILVGVHAKQMKSVLDILKIGKRKSIPKSWCGKWIDKGGKQLIIEPTKHNFYLVTVLNYQGQPFEIKLLTERNKKTENLIAKFTTDPKNRSILQVEAGVEGLGPTYDLYFRTEKDQNIRPSRNFDNLKNIKIRPSVGCGLYDDWEDDLGVPWAFPLEDFKKQKNTTRQQHAKNSAG